MDPEGVSSVTATVDGTPVTVTNSNGTYSASLTGLSVGSHTLVWSATGKNPDGTAESTTQTGQQIITVSAAPVDHPETVTLPTPTITYSGISFS